MSWFDRVLGGGGPPPWSPLDRADHHRFISAVRAALLDRGIKLDREALAAGTLPLPSDAVRPSWDLRALAAKCAHVPDGDRWYAVVADDLARHLRPPAAGAGPSPARPPRAATGRSPSRVIPPERTRRQTTELDITHLRTQVWSLANPMVAALSLDAMIHQAIGETLVEVAVWDLEDVAEHTASRDDAGLGGLDPGEVLTRGRVQAVAADVDAVTFRPIELAGEPAEVAASNAYYLGACMLQLLERMEPPAITIVCPVSTHHWILHPVTPRTSPEVLAAMRELSATILAQGTLSTTERLGGELLWWPGGALPERIAVSAAGIARLSPAQLDALQRS